MFENTIENLIKTNWLEKRSYKRREAIPKAVLLSQSSFGLLGPRRAGKSMLLFQIRDDLIDNDKKREDFAIINFEDPNLTGFKKENFDEILNTYAKLQPNKKPILLLDEVQNVEAWQKYVRNLVDRQFKVFLTGSNSSLLNKELSHQLGARVHPIKIYPLSFKEFLEFNEINLKDELDLFANQGLIRSKFEDFINYGGFPEVTLQPLQARKTTLQDYLDLVVTDVIKRNKIESDTNLYLIIRKLRENIGNEFSIASIHKSINSLGFNLGLRQCYEYAKFLEEAFLLLSIPPFKKSFAKRNTFRKTYFIDNGFVSIYDSTSEDKGQKLENIILLELVKKEAEVFYFKERGECDFITKKDGKLNAIQVTFELNDKNKEREINGLLAALSYLELEEGIIITNNQERELEVDGKKIKVIPAWKWTMETK